jgi:hypothetical protein
MRLLTGTLSDQLGMLPKNLGLVKVEARRRNVVGVRTWQRA